MYNILICDDEKDIVRALKIYLGNEGYNLFEAYNGLDALKIINNNEIHLVLLDVMMPNLNGFETISKIRENYNMPVIFISAKGEDTDKILGLNIGADDYITKPFNPVEVIARVKSNIRRYTSLGAKEVHDNVISIDGLTIDDREKSVLIDGEAVSLTPTEYEILNLLMNNPGKVYSPQDIYRFVWGEYCYGGEKSVAVHIRHLREKIEINPAEPRYIKVVWGQGYKIEKGKLNE